MGNICTRNCRYCNISTARPEPLDLEEPKHIAEAVKELGLKFAVLTSVTRDDLSDGGAQHFKNCIEEIRKISDAKIEILTPDFRSGIVKNWDGIQKAEPLETIIDAHPDVFNHNIETVKSLFPQARPQGNYELSLKILKYIKENSDILTKSGLMVGLGEGVNGVNGANGVEETLVDLKNAGVDILTIGQYIQPSKSHLEVAKYYTLEEFEELRKLAKKIGFKNYQIGPLVRSSYQAMNCFEGVKG